MFASFRLFSSLRICTAAAAAAAPKQSSLASSLSNMSALEQSLASARILSKNQQVQARSWSSASLGANNSSNNSMFSKSIIERPSVLVCNDCSSNVSGPVGSSMLGALRLMNRNARRPKKANHGSRPCSRVSRREKRRANGKWRR
jgi:hypothetical protein